MKNKIKMRVISLLLCFVMLVGLMPTSVFAAGTKLETPQNLKLQGTVLSWDAVDNADFYGITLYHPNYVYSIGSWQTDETSINLYKYLKDGETYGATVIACSNGSYQISAPAEIPLTACTNAGVPIYRDVNVVNGTSSASTAYPGMSVRLEAKPAPDGMVFDCWELSGGYINIGYSDTDTVIYVQAICDNDISARATYKYQENVTSAFTVQPQGGAALVGKYFDVTYAMNFTPQGTVKVQVEGNTPGVFTDLKQGEIDSASIKEDSVVTKTFRIVAFDGTRNIYSDEFVVSWEDGPRFISQPMGGTVDHNVDFVATYALNFTPFSCRVERYNDYLGQWSELSFASATQATISSYDFNTSSIYRIKAIIEGGGEVYSDEFTVTWSDAVSKFIQQPVGGTVGFDEDFTFTFAINFTPASNIAIQKYNSGLDSWDTVGYCASLTSGTISGYASEITNKYRLEAYENGTPIHSNEFTVTWEGTDYTVSFAANGGSGTMADVNNVSGEYTLPACGFTAPNGQRFKAWLVGGNEKAVGDKITVTANTTVTAVWEDIPEIANISATVNGAEAGATAGTTTVTTSDSTYTVSILGWYDCDNVFSYGSATKLQSSDTFVGGKTYTVGVQFTPVGSNVLANNVDATINGEDGKIGNFDGNSRDFYITVSIPTTVIQNANVYIDPPINGSKLDYTTETTGTPPYTTGVRRWYKGGNVGVPGTQLDSNAIVEPDTTYILDFTVAPNDGYALDNSTVVKLNGETAIKVSTLYGTNIAVYRVALTSPKIEIVNANAIITAPVAGENPSYNAISADPDKYDVTVDSWYLREGTFPTLNTTDTFEAGKSYAVRIKFTAKNGYTFIGATTYTINGLATTGYGEPSACQITFDIPANPPQHDFDTSEWGYKDSTGHAHVCQTPGCINHHDDIKPHVESEWKYEASVHIKTCTECGYFIKREAHIDQNDDGYCDVCETVEYVTVEIPFIKVVKQTGDKTPGQKTFKFEIFDFGHSEAADHVEIIANTVSTSGKGEFDGILKLKLTKKGYLEENYLDEGFFVKETIETAEGWEYSTAVWYVSPNFSGVGWIYKVVENGNIVPDEKDEMIFTNSYNVKKDPIAEDEKEPEKEPDKKPETQSPQTGDLAPFAVINFVLLGGLMLIYFRKKLFIK